MSTAFTTARITGLWYLGLALSGLAGSLFLQPRLIADDPATSLARLQAEPATAAWVVVLGLIAVLTQALAAVWFARLFASVDRWAANTIAAFGLVNAVMMLTGTAMHGVAATIALHPRGGAADAVFLLYLINSHLWLTASMFFGLWLIPMGVCVLRSGTMPRVLGQLLVVGGALYVVVPFVAYLVPGSAWAADVLALPATVGELWIVGYLLVRGGRMEFASGAPATTIPGATS